MTEHPQRFIDKESLQSIRNSTDWQDVFQSLGFERSKKSTENDWWALSPFTSEKTPSFHINHQGWYCHSTGQGGGIIELVQKVIEHRTGQAMNCYEAGRWLINQGLGHVGNGGHTIADSGEKKKKVPFFGKNQEAFGEKTDTLDDSAGNREPEEKKVNRPIRQTLVPGLNMEYPEIQSRGISKETCEYLGCGYLGKDSKSTLADRIVFQVRGLQETDEKGFDSIILTHM